MNSSVPFMRMFSALPLNLDLRRKLNGANVTKCVINLKTLRIYMRVRLDAALTKTDQRRLLEAVLKTYGFLESILRIENEEESVMRLNITSGVVRRAQKVVIYGPEGIGKSTLASKFPGPLFIDTENGTQHMDVRRVDAPTSWAMLMETVRAVRDNPGVCGTLVLDTADWAEMLCVSYVTANAQVDSIESFSYGKGYVYLQEEFGRLLNLMSEVVDRGVHVVITAHAKMRKFEQPDELGAYDRWEMKLSKQVGPLLKEWCDFLLFANYKTFAVATQTDKKGKPTKVKGQGGKRVMFTSHHPCWDAKNRVGLPEELPLDYAPLAQYFDAGITASENARPATQADASEKPSAAFTPKVAERDMYFYHPESETYWMIQKGEPLHGELDTSEEIDRERYEWGLKTGREPGEFRKEADGQMEITANADAPTADNASNTGNSPPPAQSGAEKPCVADPDVIVTDNGYVYKADGRRLKDALQEFYPLMETGGVTVEEVRDAIAAKGYFPADTPLENLPDDFIRGCLIGAWEQVKDMIEDSRDLPF